MPVKVYVIFKASSRSRETCFEFIRNNVFIAADYDGLQNYVYLYNVPESEMKFVTAILILTIALAIIPAAAPASAPGGMPVIKADPEAAKAAARRQKSAFTCRITGRVLCSEYGTRYKEPVVIVFVGEDYKYPAPLGEVDGGFQAELPANSSYAIRMEFKDKGFDIGSMDIPDIKEAGCSRKVEITHPGSMLELVWEIRDGQGPNVDVRLTDEKP
jgi:hypothetical protein